MPGVVETTHTFATNEVITSTLMNNIIDETVFTSDALANTTLDITAGKLKVKTSGITSNELGASAVTTASIADGAVTTLKIADSNVTGAKIAAGAVGTGNLAEASVVASKLSGAQTGSAPIFGARAYGSFNGTATSPIAAIKSGNIASITRTGSGAYTIVMATAMPDANYCVVANANRNSGVSGSNSLDVFIDSGTTFRFTVLNGAGSSYNPAYVSFSVFS